MTKRHVPSRPPAYIPPERAVRVKPSEYQPSKAEKEEEIDMPGMDDEQIRRTFFRPVRFVRDEPA